MTWRRTAPVVAAGLLASLVLPLEREFGRISRITEMTSSSTLGSTSVVLQFALDRDIDGAARDVQAAVNAARAQLPANLPNNPSYRKVNPTEAPAMILSLTSETQPIAQVFDVASSLLAQTLSLQAIVFSAFLNIAALSDAELVNFANIARECGVSSPTIKGYFAILEDTLLGRWLPAYTKRPKRRVIGAPKLYFADVGTANHLARRGALQAGSELYGKAFENWVFHELTAHNSYSEAFAHLSYWRLPGPPVPRAPECQFVPVLAFACFAAT